LIAWLWGKRGACGWGSGGGGFFFPWGALGREMILFAGGAFPPFPQKGNLFSGASRNGPCRKGLRTRGWQGLFFSEIPEHCTLGLISVGRGLAILIIRPGGRARVDSSLESSGRSPGALVNRGLCPPAVARPGRVAGFVVRPIWVLVCECATRPRLVFVKIVDRLEARSAARPVPGVFSPPGDPASARRTGTRLSACSQLPRPSSRVAVGFFFFFFIFSQGERFLRVAFRGSAMASASNTRFDIGYVKPVSGWDYGAAHRDDAKRGLKRAWREGTGSRRGFSIFSWPGFFLAPPIVLPLVACVGRLPLSVTRPEKRFVDRAMGRRVSRQGSSTQKGLFGARRGTPVHGSGCESGCSPRRKVTSRGGPWASAGPAKKNRTAGPLARKPRLVHPAGDGLQPREKKKKNPPPLQAATASKEFGI